jgi:quinol monooxygenase YgiN
MIGVIATLKIKDGETEAFETGFNAMAAQVRANEPGNVAYLLTKSRTEPNTYKVLEIYKDQAALDAHREYEHFKAGGKVFGGTLAGRPEVELLDGIG